MKQPVTKIFVAINVLVHLYVWVYLQGTQGPGAADALIDRFGLTPAEFRNGAFWQPLTALFLHDGRVFPIIHIGFNMLAIWSFGLALENTLGSIRFAWLMFVSGCASSLFVILFQADLPNPTIGASGIVLGLLGALAVFYPNSQMLIFFIPMRARNAAILIGVLSIVLPMFGVLTFISHMGHLGGLVGGVLYSWFALGLRLGQNDLRERESYIRRKVQEQEYLREMLERLQRASPRFQGTSRERWKEPDEKVINPRPEDVQGPEKRLYYDPTTGKFYTR